MSDNERDFVDKDLPEEVEAQLKQGKPIWQTAELTRDYEVLGFLAPYVAVRKRSTGEKGTLLFTHRPRYYYGWVPEEG